MSDETQEDPNAPEEIDLTELEATLSESDLTEETREQILNELDQMYQQRERLIGQLQQIVAAQNENRPPHEVKHLPVEERTCPIPPQAEGHPESIEILRLWIEGEHKGLTAMLLPGVFPDPYMWGAALVEVARHIAHGWGEQFKVNPNEVLDRLADGWDNEVERENDGDQPTGTTYTGES